MELQEIGMRLLAIVGGGCGIAFSIGLIIAAFCILAASVAMFLGGLAGS